MRFVVKEELAIIQESYEGTPYESYPYPNSTPDKLEALGTLFGMKPPKIGSARVLELGCAAGGNIIPHAVHYPKGKYVGIDLSARQIEDGQKTIKQLGLKNVDLKCMSISDIDNSLGEFDYIIVHGVFSWVPEYIQKKILEVCKKHLVPNGIAYISYNTLPGWNMLKTIRDMMLYHAQNFGTAQDKITQSRALLSFVKESLEGQDTAYAKMLAQEAELLSKQADHYIFHEHLEANNTAFYFSDFVIEAAKHDLQYLSDTSINTMYLGNLQPKVATKLKDITNIVQMEQYLDFINNRRFRSTLLCHKKIKLNRSLDSDFINKFAVSMNIVPAKPAENKMFAGGKIEELHFFVKGNKDNALRTTSPHLAAILYVLANNIGFPLKAKKIIEKANQLFKTDESKQLEQLFLQNAMNLVLKGVMDISLHEKDKAKCNFTKPKINQLIRSQIESGKNWVTTSHHHAARISIFDQRALGHMDGKRTLDKICDLLVKDTQEGILVIKRKEQKIDNVKEVKTIIARALANSMNKYITEGMLA